MKSDLFLRSRATFAISVEANDVDINLNFFSLLGSTTNGGTSVGIGITASDVQALTVRNGVIGYFNVGVSMDHSSGIVFDGVRLLANGGVAARLDRCTASVIQNCVIDKIVPALNPNSSAGIEISGGTGNEVVNTRVAGTDTEPYVFGIGVGGNSRGSYFESDYIVNCETALKLGPDDKYRAITTTRCPGGIKGGMDVDGQSN